MDFNELIKKRESVRNYSDKEVEKEKIIQCIEAAHIAPSACNSQPWKFIVINEKKILNDLALASSAKPLNMNKFLANAPIIIAVVNTGMNFTAKTGSVLKKQPYDNYDIGIAVAHFCLQATELNLGTCIIGWFDEKKVKSILNVPNKNKVSLLISLGYPKNDKIRNKSRKKFDDIISFNKY